MQYNAVQNKTIPHNTNTKQYKQYDAKQHVLLQNNTKRKKPTQNDPRQNNHNSQFNSRQYNTKQSFTEQFTFILNNSNPYNTIPHDNTPCNMNAIHHSTTQVATRHDVKQYNTIQYKANALSVIQDHTRQCNETHSKTTR